MLLQPAKVKEIGEWLSRKDRGTLVVTGPSGSGKTYAVDEAIRRSKIRAFKVDKHVNDGQTLSQRVRSCWSNKKVGIGLNFVVVVELENSLPEDKQWDLMRDLGDLLPNSKRLPPLIAILEKDHGGNNPHTHHFVTKFDHHIKFEFPSLTAVASLLKTDLPVCKDARSTMNSIQFASVVDKKKKKREEDDVPVKKKGKFYGRSIAGEDKNNFARLESLLSLPGSKLDERAKLFEMSSILEMQLRENAIRLVPLGAGYAEFSDAMSSVDSTFPSWSSEGVEFRKRAMAIECALVSQRISALGRGLSRREKLQFPMELRKKKKPEHTETNNKIFSSCPPKAPAPKTRPSR